VIFQALKDLTGLRGETDLEVLKKELKKTEEAKDKAVKELRSLKFRVISGKTLAFSDKQLERAVVDIREGVKVMWTVKDTEIEV
jgi:hypothetical protein